jgi:ATP-binding cassette, subfamily C (CFTR/MRP), member 1
VSLTLLVPMGINFIMIAYVSIKRLNKFMNSPELDSNSVNRNPSEFSLKIQDGNFSWGGKEKILKSINISVKKGSLSAVVGPVGSGKSSLIGALLGEMEKTSGSVNIDGRIAYVPQQAWIQNATVQDNILFGKSLNKRLYEKVINACALAADLAMLPGGDQTEIGEKGINLSGGQKQRISLARAVYSGAEIFIFDDPLSAVDAHVGKHIFENVMSNEGILRGKTRFLVTHALYFLPKVDEIYVMTNGEISESGTYMELLSKKGAFSEFLVQYLQEHQDEDGMIFKVYSTQNLGFKFF